MDGYYLHTISSKNMDAFNVTGTAATAFDLATSGGLYTLVGQDLTINFAALAKAGKTEILSRPSILTRINQQATITIGQQVPLISGVTYDNFGNQRNAITYQDVGIILRVTPFITSDGLVEICIRVEDDPLHHHTDCCGCSGGGLGAGGIPDLYRGSPAVDLRTAGVLFQWAPPAAGALDPRPILTFNSRYTAVTDNGEDLQRCRSYRFRRIRRKHLKR